MSYKELVLSEDQTRIINLLTEFDGSVLLESEIASIFGIEDDIDQFAYTLEHLSPLVDAGYLLQDEHGSGDIGLRIPTKAETEARARLRQVMNDNPHRRNHRSYVGDWCKQDDCEFQSYPEDGQCVCGVYKHHVHCQHGYIIQVG